MQWGSLKAYFKKCRMCWSSLALFKLKDETAMHEGEVLYFCAARQPVLSLNLCSRKVSPLLVLTPLFSLLFFFSSMDHVPLPRCSYFLSSQAQMRGTSAQADGDALRGRSRKS